MTHHSTAFEVERPVPAGDAVQNLLPDANAKAGTSEPARSSVVVRKFNFRRALMTGAAVAALAGAARHGLHAGSGIAAAGERVPRGLVNDLPGLVIGADLRAAPAAPVLGDLDLSHAFT